MPVVKHNDSYKRNPGETQLENKAEMSAIFKEMALTLFRVPEAMPSSEAAHAPYCSHTLHGVEPSAEPSPTLSAEESSGSLRNRGLLFGPS